MEYIFNCFGGPKKDRLFWLFQVRSNLLGAGVLGDGLGALRDGVLGQFTGEEEPDSSLHFTGGDSGPLVVVSKTAGLSSDGSKRTDFIAFST